MDHALNVVDLLPELKRGNLLRKGFIEFLVFNFTGDPTICLVLEYLKVTAHRCLYVTFKHFYEET